MRVAIACGGTGGHIFPAIALTHELKRRGYSYIVFIVDDNKRAIDIIESAGFDFVTLKVPKMPYGFSIKWPGFVIGLIISRFKAEKLLMDINPDVVAGFGAYICGPVISAAKFMDKKIILHEQNAVLGRANRLLISKADKVCFGFYNKLLQQGSKYVYTGNPIRNELIEDFKTLTKAAAIKYLDLYPGRKTILVLGGSAGSSFLNNLLAEMSALLTEPEKRDMQIVHITGQAQLDFVSENYRRNGITYWLSSYFNRMAVLYKAADIVISRSGAATVTEASLFGVPALFIPYKGAGNHQRENALVAARENAAIVFDEDDITAEMLKEEISSLVKSEARIKSMSFAMRSMAKLDAAERLADELEELINA